MAKINTQKNNLATGEKSPELKGRNDLPLFQSTTQKQINFEPMPQGGSRYRNGSEFKGFCTITITNNREIKSRLIPFIFNNNQVYCIEIYAVRVIDTQANYASGIRVHKDVGFTKTLDVDLFPNRIRGVIKGETTIILSESGNAIYDDAYIEGSDYYSELNGGPYQILSYNAAVLDEMGDPIQDSYGTFATELDLDSSDFEFDSFLPTDTDKLDGTLHRNGAVDVGGSSSITWDNVENINYFQNSDQVYLLHNDFQPIYIKREDEDEWSFNSVFSSGVMHGDWTAGNYPTCGAFFEQRLVLSGVPSQPQKVYMSKTAIYNDFTTGTEDDKAVVFEIASNRVSRIVSLIPTEDYLIAGTGGGSYRIGSQGNTGITPSNIDQKPIDNIPFADIQPLSVEKNILFVQKNRQAIRSLVYSSDYESLVAENLNLISNHFFKDSPIKRLALQNGDYAKVWALKDNGELIGLTFNAKENIAGFFRLHLRDGDFVHDVTCLPNGSNEDEVWIITNRARNGSRQYFVEKLTNPTFFPMRMDFFSGDKEADQKAFDIAIESAQRNALHLDCSRFYDGSLLTLNAGASLTPGAVTGEGVTFSTDVDFFNSSMVGRELWAKEKYGKATIVSYVNAQNVTCDITVDFDDINTMNAGDWYLTTNKLSGMHPLYGETVSIVTDGAIHPDVENTGSFINLDYQSAVVKMGLAYTGLIITNNFETGAENGESVSKTKQFSRVVLKLLNTLGIKVGADPYKLEQLFFRSASDSSNTAVPPFTGDKDVSINSSWDSEKSMVICQDKPLPCTILSIVAEVDTSAD